MTKIHTTVKGEYKVEVLSADGTVLRGTGWFDNVITNIGLDRMAQGSCTNICRVGTGNTAPVVTDTALDAQIAATGAVLSSTGTRAGAPNYEQTQTYTYQFALGDVVGNVAEVGVGWATSGATLFSRSLILDAGLSPTTITVLVTEILQVSYRTTVYIDLADVVTTITIGGVSTTCTVRPMSIASSPTLALQHHAAFVQGTYISQTVYNGSIGALTDSPSGGNTGGGNYTWGTYTPGTYSVNVTMFLDINVGNLAGGISATTISTTGGYGLASSQTFWQIGFSPAIAKDATKTLSLVFNFSWGRH